MSAKKKKRLDEELIDDLLDLEEDDAKSSGPFKKKSGQTHSDFDAEVSNLFDAVAHEIQEPSIHEENTDSKTEIVDYKPQISAEEVLHEDTFEMEDPVNVEESDQTLKIADASLSQPSYGDSRVSSSQDKTVVAGQTGATNYETRVGAQQDSVEDRVRASVGRFAALQGQGSHSTMSAALAQSENLRIAQSRILELEEELERVRQENEKLAAVSETFRKRADAHAARIETLEDKMTRDKDSANHERNLITQSLEAKRQEVESLTLKIDELEMRLSSNIQKIRVRERELENRLELVKMEGQALVRSKDEIILDLKRQLDQTNHELDNYRVKGQDLNKQISDKQDMLRRTVKALRIALSMLEGDESDGDKRKKL
ncbi:MAG: hypothetical protein KDD22_01160 [Bdellovibrionales bacterium]|nr:hypothetical protein [Bdellovibrionales bacterium]